MKRVVVVGSGLAGLSVANRLVSAGIKPLVVEREPQVGGHCRSFRYGDYTFDVGIHCFDRSEDEVGEFLMSHCRQTLVPIPQKKVACYFRGAYRQELGIERLRYLPLPLLLRGLWDLVRQERPADGRSLQGAVEACYGRTFFDIVVRQRIERLLGVPCDQVHVDVGTLFWLIPPKEQLSRATLAKKILQRLRAVFRFRAAEDASTAFEAFYPSPRGFGGFCESLAQTVIAGGGTVRTGASIDSVQVRQGLVTGVMINGQLEEADELVWTGEITPLLRLLGLAAEAPLPSVNLVLFNFEMAGSPAHDYLWVEYADADPLVARASLTTLHRPANAPAGHYGISAEVPCRADETIWEDPASFMMAVQDQLVRTKFVPDRSSFGPGHIERFSRVWPLLDVAYQERLDRSLASLAQAASNVHLTNQAGGGFQPIGRIIRRALEVSKRIAEAPAPPSELIGSRLS